MPLKDGKRGSLIFSCTLTTAGSVASTLKTLVGLPLTADLGALDDHGAHMGHLGQPEVFGDDGRDRAAGTVAGRIAGDDQLGALDGAQRASQGPAGLDHVRAVQAGVEQVHTLVGAHRERLADGLAGFLRAGGQHGHGAVAAFAP